MRVLGKVSAVYPATSGVRFTAAKKLQALRRQTLEDKYISEELAYYVAPNGQSFPSSDASEPLQPWVHKEFLQSDARVLLLKGAGGAGKSTFNRELMRQLWQDKAWAEWKPGSSPPKVFVPIFIPLGSSQVDPKRLLAYLGNLPAPLESFTEEEINVLKADYQLLLIADGYDEIPGQLHLNLYDVNGLDRFKGRIKLLISSRILEGRERVDNSRFVPHQSGSESILEWRYYKERYMAPFSDDQIADYLRQYLARNKDRTDITLWPDVESYQKQFAALPELRELITTPFLLLMTADVLPSIVREVEDTLATLPEKEKKEKEKGKADSSLPRKERKIKVKDEDFEDQKATPAKQLEKQEQRQILTRAKLYHHFMAQWFARQAQKAVAAKDILTDPETLLGTDVVQLVTGTGDVLAAELLQQAYKCFCQTLASQLQTEGCVSVQYPVESKRRGRLGTEIESTSSVTTSTTSEWAKNLFGSKDPDWIRVRKGCPLRQSAHNEYQFLHASLIDYFVITVIAKQATAAPEVQETKDKIAVVSEIPTKIIAASETLSEPKMSAPPAEEPVVIPASTSSPKPTRRKGRLGASSSEEKSDLIMQRLLSRNTVQLSADDLKETNDRSRSLRVYYDSLIKQSKIDETFSIGAANAITILNTAGENFSARDYRDIRIPGADLSGALLDSTDLRNADLTHVCLQGAWLRAARLNQAKLKSLEFSELPYLESKHGRAFSIAFSPDGQWLAIALGELIEIREWPSRQIRMNLSGHATQLAWHPQKRWLASGGDKNGSVQLWDTARGTLLKMLSGHSEEVAAVVWHPQGKYLASGSHDKTIQIWDEKNKKSLRKLIGHTKAVESLTWHPQGKYLASGSQDNSIRIWDVECGKLLHILTGHTNIISTLAWHPHNQWLASGSWDKTIRLWTEQGELLRTLSGHSEGISSVAWHPHDMRLASCSEDQTIRLYQADNGKLLRTLTGHQGHVHSISWHPQGQWLVSAGSYKMCADKTVRFWNIEHEASLHSREAAHVNNIFKLAWHPQSKCLVSLNSTVRLWDPHGRLVYTLGYSESGLTIACHPLNMWMAIGGSKGIQIWDVEYNKLLYTIATIEAVFSVVWHPQGTFLAFSTSKRLIIHSTLIFGASNIQLWDVEHKILSVLTDGSDSREHIHSIAWDRQGEHLVSVGQTLKLWDVARKKILHTLTDCSFSVVNAFHPEKTWLAYVSDDSINLWDVEKKRSLGILTEYSHQIRCMAWHPQGKWLASGDVNGTVQLLKLESSDCLKLHLPLMILSLAWQKNSGEDSELAISFGNNIACFAVNLRLRQITLQWLVAATSLCLIELDFTNASGLNPTDIEFLHQHGAMQSRLQSRPKTTEDLRLKSLHSQSLSMMESSGSEFSLASALGQLDRESKMDFTQSTQRNDISAVTGSTTPLITRQSRRDYSGSPARTVVSKPQQFGNWMNVFNEPNTVVVSVNSDTDFQRLSEEKKSCCRCTLL